MLYGQIFDDFVVVVHFYVDSHFWVESRFGRYHGEFCVIAVNKSG